MSEVPKPRTTRDAAAKSAQRRYFSGDPCPAGHVAERYTLNGYCVECQRIANAEDRARKRAQLAGQS